MAMGVYLGDRPAVDIGAIRSLRDRIFKMQSLLRVVVAALASVAFASHIANAQQKRDGVGYNRKMPSGCSGVIKRSAGDFVLEECTRDGIRIIKTSSVKTFGKGVALLTFGGSHSNYSGYYCSGIASGLGGATGQRAHFECTPTGWRRLTLDTSGMLIKYY